MFREFGRSLENPERIVEGLEKREGTEGALYDIDEMMDLLDEENETILPEQQRTQPTAELAEEPNAQGPEDTTSAQQTTVERASEASKVDLASIREGKQKMLSQREKFMASIKYVEPQKTKTPLEQAQIEYRRALQVGDKMTILRARDTVLDLQRQEELEAEKKERELISQMKAEARETGNPERLRSAQAAQMRLYSKMQRSELKYLTAKEKVSNDLGLAPDLRRRDIIESLQEKVGTIKDAQANDRDR